MGTGKAAAGREIARRLCRPFVDMDAEIEARAGRSIAEIFRAEGEAAFRRLEAALCRELAARQGLVVATGGGVTPPPPPGSPPEPPESPPLPLPEPPPQAAVRMAAHATSSPARRRAR